MKLNKLVMLGILSLLLIQLVSAVDLEVNKTDKGSVVISELNNPAIFQFDINNLGAKDNFEIYTLLGISFSPKGTFELSQGKNTLDVRAYPSAEIRKNTGFFTFEYQIRGQDTGIFKDTMMIKIVHIANIFEIGAQDITPGDNQAFVSLVNLENTNIENLSLHLSSAFFDENKVVSLKPFEEINVSVVIDKDKALGLVAGQYPYSVDFDLSGATSKLEGKLNYIERAEVRESSVSNGVIIRETSITKTNTGNIKSQAVVEVNRDILSRLFTTFSENPAKSEKKGLIVKYSWEKTLSPGEKYSVNVKTNYTFSLIILVLIVIIALVAKIFSITPIVLEKKVSFVRTKGGEFALKVRVHVKAKKHADNIQIIDRLPGMTKLFEKFGSKPDKIDLSSGRLFFNIPHLNAGEERVFSYIIFSKVAVVGRFELPAAMAVYEKDGKTLEVMSNRAFFVSDTFARNEDMI